jgi:hypothetical protein
MAKATAIILLLILAITWSAISIQLGVMIAVSENFMYLVMFLGSVIFGDEAITRFKR